MTEPSISFLFFFQNQLLLVSGVFWCWWPHSNWSFSYNGSSYTALFFVMCIHKLLRWRYTHSLGVAQEPLWWKEDFYGMPLWTRFLVGCWKNSPWRCENTWAGGRIVDCAFTIAFNERQQQFVVEYSVTALEVDVEPPILVSNHYFQMGPSMLSHSNPFPGGMILSLKPHKLAPTQVSRRGSINVPRIVGMEIYGINGE